MITRGTAWTLAYLDPALQVMEHADAKQMVARAYLIDEVENTASLLSVARSYMSARRTEYHPRYVHVLSVHEEKLSQVQRLSACQGGGVFPAKRGPACGGRHFQPVVDRHLREHY